MGSDEKGNWEWREKLELLMNMVQGMKMWKKIDRAKEIGRTDKPIETSEFPVYKPNCNLTTCRYNANGKCENEEKRKECVEVSRKVLCLEGKDEKGEEITSNEDF